MSRYLLDSDAVIDYLAGVTPSVELIRDLHDRGESLCVCDVVVAEVYSGLNPKYRDKAQKLLTGCSFLVIEPEHAQLAGEWRYNNARRGITLSTTDMLVAAVAYGHGATIVTGNTDDYPMAEVSVLPLPRVKS
ncbi:MAG: PIN domain-containing protein [Chloroflexi bacterium]|nr:PIN domain-containing protein [Chloroflexota bacterium]